MPLITPAEILNFCNTQLSENITFDFTKFEGGEGTMYFADYVTVKESPNEVWKAVKNVKPAPTRFTVEQGLQILCKSNGYVIAKSPDDKRTNDEMIIYYSRLATGRYVQNSLDSKVDAGLL